MSDLNLTLGKKIQIIRLLHQPPMKQADLARILGVPQSRISKWENGQMQPEPNELNAIQSLFDVRFGTPEIEMAFLILSSDRVARHLVTAALDCLERRGEPAPVAGSIPAVVMPR